MDTHATLIILAITALIVLPFFIINQIKKRKHMKFDKDLINMADKEKMMISQKEIWNHRYAICIDTDSRKLLYIKNQKDKQENHIFNLSDIKDCRSVNIDKTLKYQTVNKTLTDRLELKLTFRNPEIPEKTLEFFESPDFMPNDEDHSRINKWLQIIKNNL